MSHAQKIADNMNITNTLSVAHAIVKGAKMSLIPPDGFTQASNFNGFHQVGSQSSIMVIEIPGPYNEVSAALTKEGEQFAQGIMFTKYMLAFGSEEFIYQVMLFSDNLYYLILGFTEDDYEINLNLFRSVANTFKRK